MAKLSTLNYLNVVAYILNTVVTFAVGLFGVLGTPTNGELSAKYPTLITPAGWTFAIWAVIFTFQAIFTITQLFGAYRSSYSVTQVVKYNYIGACVAQAAWTVAFAFEVIWLAYVFMLGILWFLLIIVRNQYKSEDGSRASILNFFLLQFPFQIHCGWICVASLLNLSVTLVAYDANATIQYITAVISALNVILLSVWYLTKPVYVTVLVFGWACFGISAELGNAPELIREAFSARSLSVLQYTLLTVGIVEVLAVVGVFIYNTCNNKGQRGTAGETIPLIV